MVVLVLPLAVQGISVGTVAEGRAFVVDRLGQNLAHRRVQVPPIAWAEPIAGRLRVEPGDVEDFGGI
jgi:hypothetical protein